MAAVDSAHGEPPPPLVRRVKVIGRYALHTELATGGMATVYLGRLLGPVGFSRTVAIKRLHQQFAKDPEFTIGFLDEARLAARIRHPNVVPTLDVVALEGELFLVMEYVHGESLAQLALLAHEKHEPVPVSISIAIMSSVLHGLHAAHEARNERGDLLGLVHRDVSPQNILVGADGVPRLLDFGVAKAVGRVQNSRDDKLKGKLAYMAPEQVMARPVSRQSDVFAAAVVLWELLTGRRLFRGQNEAETIYKVLQAPIEPPSKYAPSVSPALDDAVMRGLERAPEARYASARDMAFALERVVTMLSPHAVAEWVDRVAGEALARRARQLAEVEQVPTEGLRSTSWPPPPAPVRPSLATVVTDREEIETGRPSDASGALSRTFRRATASRRSLLISGAALLALALGATWLSTRAREPASPSLASPAGETPRKHTATPVAPVSAPLLSARHIQEPVRAAEADAAPAAVQPSARSTAGGAPTRTRPAKRRKPEPSLYSRE